MLGSLRNVLKSLVVVSLFASVNSQAYIISKHDNDPGRVNLESYAAEIALIGAGVTFFIPVVGLTVPPLLVAAGVFDGQDASVARFNPEQNLADLVRAGVYTESEAQSIVSDLTTANQDLAAKMKRLGCAQAKACKADSAALQSAMNFRPLTMQYLNNVHGVQN